MFFVALNSCSLFCAEFEKNRQQFFYNEGFAWHWENLSFWISIFCSTRGYEKGVEFSGVIAMNASRKRK